MENHYSAFDRIIGYENVKRHLMFICDMFNDLDKYEQMNVSMPGGVLLQGNPGYGKTLIATCFIEACNRPYFICRRDRSGDDFIYHLKNCFEEAVKNAPSIVFLDDMDKYANEDENHKNAEEYVTVQSCIDNVKGKNVFVIATTNDINNLPESLLRSGRFDFIFTMKGLDRCNQIKLINHYLADKPMDKNISSEEIWQILGSNVSCADLEKIINTVAMKTAFSNKNVISRDDFIDGCLDFCYGERDMCLERSKEEIEMIAYHEAGHVVVNELLFPGHVGMASINRSEDSSTGGVTCLIEKDKIMHSVENLENEAVELLAGKAATEIVFGIADTGSREDFLKARSIIKDIKDDYIAYSIDTKYSYYNGTLSENISCNALNFKLNELFSKAKKLICNNRDFLDNIAKSLMEQKIIFLKDIQRIKNDIYSKESTI